MRFYVPLHIYQNPREASSAVDPATQFWLFREKMEIWIYPEKILLVEMKIHQRAGLLSLLGLELSNIKLVRLLQIAAY